MAAALDHPRTTAECIFCGYTGKMSPEHVLPLWIRKKFGGGTYTYRWGSLAGPTPPTSAEKVAGMSALKANVVCHDCNTGWCSDIETEASGLLGPMMVNASTQERQVR